MPYWRLSSVYFFYFAVVGALSPYWGLYLQHLNFEPHEIGAFIAVPMVTKLLVPNIWSWLSDRIGKRMLVVRLGSLGACVAFCGIFYWNDYASLMFYIVLYSIFWNAVLPQFETITLSYLGDEAYRYSKVRLWGSVGFICTVVTLGLLLEVLSIDWLPVFILAFLSGIFIFACTLPPLSVVEHANGPGNFIGSLLRNRSYLFFIILFFLQFSHGVYYSFYSIYLEEHGYPKWMIGVLWALGVVSEIVVFIYIPRLFKRFSVFHLFSVSLFATAIRWLVIGTFPSNLVVITLAQGLHALSFGVAHAVAIQFIKSTFSESEQGQAQAFYAASSFGGGAALGAYFSGWVWSMSPVLCFYISALSALLAWLLSLTFLRRKI